MGTKEYEYCVIKFTQSENLLVDLLPISWVHNEKDDLKCFYPPKKQYYEIDDLVKNILPARKHWKSYTIEILYNAVDYEHEQTKLEKCYSIVNCNVESLKSQLSSLENFENPEKVKAVSPGEANKILDDLGKKYSATSNEEKRKGQVNSGKKERKKDIEKNKKQDIKNQPSKRKNEKSAKVATKKRRLCFVSSSSDDTDIAPGENSSSDAENTETQKESLYKSKSAVPNDEKDKGSDIQSGNAGLINENFSEQKTDNSSKGSEFSEIPVQSTSNEPFDCDDNGLSPAVKNYFDKNFEKIYKQQYDNRRSLSHDLNEYRMETLHAISMIKNSENPLDKNYKIKFPLCSLDDFYAYDKIISQQEQAKDTFKALAETYTLAHKSYKEFIRNLLTYVMSVDLQRQFSATGKGDVDGTPKINFSGTEMFKLFRDIQVEKYKETPENILSYVSRWFTGAKDRGPGAKKTVQAGKKGNKTQEEIEEIEDEGEKD